MARQSKKPAAGTGWANEVNGREPDRAIAMRRVVRSRGDRGKSKASRVGRRSWFEPATDPPYEASALTRLGPVFLVFRFFEADFLVRYGSHERPGTV